MKIAILIPRVSGGGAEDVARKWCVGLRALGHHVEFVLTHDDVPPGIAGLDSFSLAANSGTFAKVAEFRKRVKAARYDAVISLMPYCNLLALIATAGLGKSKPSVVISEHTIHAELSKRYTLSHQIQWQLAQRLYRYSAATVAVSHAVAAELTSICRVPASRLWVVPNPAAEGIEVRSFRPAVARLHPTSGKTLAVVVPTRLIPQKRLDLAMQTALLVAQESDHQVRIEFFGEGPEKLRLAEMATLNGIPCIFRGWVDRWYDHIPEDGIVLVPSGSEGFGNVLIEAAARSVPSVVSSKALGVADACIAEVTGKLVCGDTPVDYADGVLAASEMVLPDLRKWLARFTSESAAHSLSLVLSAAKTQ